MDKFVLAVVDVKMVVKSHIDQAIIAAPTVGVNHRRHVNFAANNGLQGLFLSNPGRFPGTPGLRT